MRMIAALSSTVLVLLALAGCGVPSATAEQQAAGLQAFAVVEAVFQHPRCANCHIPGDAPLQGDDGMVHVQHVRRGPEGKGAPGLPCATCHAEANPPASYGPHAPPGAPHWQLPPPDMKMAWIGVDAARLCELIKDPARNGDRDLAAMTRHVSEDALVLWGWAPGAGRAPVPVAHAQFEAAFRTWVDAGAPCPAPTLAATGP
jgi:hypothetical protein